MRKLLFEFEDLSWFPDTIRESMTDYLRYFLKVTKFYKPVIPLVSEILKQTNLQNIIDLCSGSGGPVEEVLSGLNATSEGNIKVTLTDKFPNISSYTLLQNKYPKSISFESTSIDAKNVPEELKGLRTIFSGIHHFDEVSIGEIIHNAIQNNAPIGIFDGGDRNIFMILGIILFHPLLFFLFTPFFRPFRISRLIFTYLIPIIPFCTVCDGIVSITRLYAPEHLERIARVHDEARYTWKSGKVKNSLGMNVTYLIGSPKR